MIYRVTHTTTYDYTDSISLSHHLLRLSPRNLPHQRCLHHEVHIDPQPAIAERHVDYFGNAVTFLTIEGAHKKLVVKSESNVSLMPPAVPVSAETPAWENVRESGRGRQMGHSLEGSEFVFDSPLVRTTDDFAAYAAPSFPKNRSILGAALDLTKRIHADFKFDPKATTLATPLEELFKNRRGVCQDFAHFQIGCLRAMGLPARYVSGYMETVPPPGKPRLAGADASHAWVQVFIPPDTWVDVDPTNNILPSDRHIVLGWGRDFDDVSPIRGVIIGGGKHELKVGVDVIPVQASQP